jgi:nicotinamidase-related amidase
MSRRLGNIRPMGRIMQRPLLVLDVQRGFVTEYNRLVPAAIASIIKAELFSPVIFTRLVNVPGSPMRLFLQTEHMSDPGTAGMDSKIAEVMGAQIPPLNQQGVADLGEGHRAMRFLLTKSSYTAVTPEFEELLGELALENTGIYVTGTGTECQVLKTALDLFERGIEPIVLSEFCGSHRGLGMHEKGIELLRELIGPERVIKDYMPLRQRWERARTQG